MLFRRLCTTVAVSAAALLTLSFAHAESRVALVIGNGAYQNVAHLPNPVNDANLIADALRQDGFAVTLADDLDRTALANTLRTFGHQADNADWAVIYYAGHGMEMAGINYLIPVDAKLETDRDVGLEAVPLDQVMSAIEGARALRLVILDACRDDPFAAAIKRTAGAGRDIGRGLARVEPAQATLVAYSAKDGSIARDGDGADSPYALALAKHLTEPGVEINKMFRLVYDDVQDATGKGQQPFLYGAVPGREDFYFRPAATTATQGSASTETPGSTRSDIEVVFWQSIEHSTAVADFQAYLKKFPNGVFADLARTRIAALEPASPQKTTDTGAAKIEAPPAAPHASLGVQVQNMNDDIAKSLGLKSAHGALVVKAAGPAATAGIAAQDVIIEFDGHPIDAVRDLPPLVAAEPIGKAVPVKILRNGQEQTLTVKLGRVDNTAVASATAKLPEGSSPQNLFGPSSNDSTDGSATAKMSSATVPFIGNAKAPVVVTYWSDYQCPYCRVEEEDVLSRLIKEYVETGKVKVEFKEVTFIGPDSQTADLAGRAVWEVAPNRFFQWYKTVLSHQGAENSGWASKDNIIALTRTVPGIDADTVARLMTEHAAAYQKLIEADRAEAAAKGVVRVPAAIIGTQLILNAQPYVWYKTAIDSALKQSPAAASSAQ
jgi:protein-disulfide isomerase